MALVVKPEDIVDTENLTTLFAVVNKANKRSWYEQYETLCHFVVSCGLGCVPRGAGVGCIRCGQVGIIV